MEDDHELASVLISKPSIHYNPNNLPFLMSTLPRCSIQYATESEELLDENKSHVTLESNVGKLNFEYLDEFIRFDVARTGSYCCTGYEVSIQYDDYFLRSKSKSLCWNFISNSKSISLTHGQDQVLSISFSSFHSCCSSKKIRHFRIATPELEQFGGVNFEGKNVRVYNYIENHLFTREKIDNDSYHINAENGGNVAIINIYRELRGAISTYGLSFIGETISPSDKALLIALTLVMDIKVRESEITCCLCYTPLITTIVILLFVVLPFVFVYD